MFQVQHIGALKMKYWSAQCSVCSNVVQSQFAGLMAAVETRLGDSAEHRDFFFFFFF